MEIKDESKNILYTGTYINFCNGNAGEFFSTVATTFICKNIRHLESVMITYIIEDLDYLCDEYDDDEELFESDEEMLKYFIKKYPTFKKQIHAIKNILRKQRNSDYNDIQAEIAETRIDNEMSCPYNTTSLVDSPFE